jgi:hypothetical protein
VWQDTTNANPLFDSPIYEEFYRAVRDPLADAVVVALHLADAPGSDRLHRPAPGVGADDSKGKPTPALRVGICSGSTAAAHSLDITMRTSPGVLLPEPPDLKT